MRPPRLLILLFCFIFLPILLTFLSLITAEPRRGVDADPPLADRSSRLRALFSFNAPASLFPPSAIISLTDDNSTFFLARPAAFGPLLPAKGLSGQLWIGSGFGEDTLRKGVATAGTEGELGCSDVPGWDKDGKSNPEKGVKALDNQPVANPPVDAGPLLNRRTAAPGLGPEVTKQSSAEHVPSVEDGTDDHLHHPLGPSEPQNTGDKKQPPTHADIQSLQESAEIAGKVVLLSRGGCGFLEKVKWVQRRGGTALIVGDDTKGGSLVTMYARGDTSNITIPAVFTSYTTAHLLSSLIPEREGFEDALKVAQGDSSVKSPTNKGKQNPAVTTTTKGAAGPTSTSAGSKQGPIAEHATEKSLVQTLLSAIGLGNRHGYLWTAAEDSHRPPSSGSLDWVLANDWDEKEKSPKSKASTAIKDHGTKAEAESKDHQSKPADGDGFEIGVHDWRDPDLVPPKNTPDPQSKPTTDTSDTQKSEPKDENSHLKGGSITPGSGEYTHTNQLTESQKSKNEGSTQNVAKEASSGSSQVEEDWFSSHFGWNEATDEELDRIVRNRQASKSSKGSKSDSDEQQPAKADTAADGHEGLWVTLTPTSMSTSPFFDTLLVLVVSPLVTLTVVYALLLLRSRIRRRRWRAPKSVVERLPIRTYHTMPSQSSTTSSSPRSPSPGAATATSPLLSAGPGETSRRPRPRSRTVSGVVAPTSATPSSKEKSGTGTSLWRRKYIGKQVECVVCLEEYVDGQSRVMSLPCGHEFHAECM
jgi:hypothetical protein